MDIPNFINLLDEALITEAQDRQARSKNYQYKHNPSSASYRKADGKVVGACQRQLYYRAKKVDSTRELDTTSMIQGGFGDAIHTWLLDKLTKVTGISLMKEAGGKLIVDPLTLEMSYRLDGLVTVGDVMGGLEIKTTQGRAITGKDWGIKDKGPKDDHLLQVICYMKAHPSLKWFALVYFGRDNAYRMQFDVKREGDKFFWRKAGAKSWTPVEFDFEGIQKRWLELEAHIDGDILPPRDYKVWLKADGSIQDTKYIKGDFFKSDFRCLYCPYSKKCWTEEPDADKDCYK